MIQAEEKNASILKIKRSLILHLLKLSILLLILGLTVYNSIESLRNAPIGGSGASTIEVMRLSNLKKDLGNLSNRGNINYIGDRPGTHVKDIPDLCMEEYFLSQFILAPTILELGNNKLTWAMGNLRNPKLDPADINHWQIIKNYGQGVLLLKNQSR